MTGSAKKRQRLQPGRPRAPRHSLDRLVRWCAAKTAPDADLSVLIFSVTDDIVEQGFWDGEDWRYASGGSAGEVSHWAELPDPPNDKVSDGP